MKPYLDGLEQKGFAPGGGSAGALAFCLGCSLIAKSINHSKAKNIAKYQKDKLNNCLRKISIRKKDIYPFIDRDGELFSKMIKSKGEARQKYLKEVNRLLMALAESSYEVFLLAKGIDSDIKRNIKSDFNLGLEFVKLAMLSALYNLETNSELSGKEDKYSKKIKKKYTEIKSK